MDTNQTPNENRPRNNRLALQLSIGALVIALYFGVLFYNKNKESNTNQPTLTENTGTNTASNENTGTTPAETATNNQPSGTYKDGTYTASGSYISPGGQESVSVKLTLTNDIVTTAEVTPKAATPTSTQFQNEFVNNYKQFVVGKKLSDLKLSKVAGSSLTPRGFNNAIEAIKTQAQS
jgi:uncharacterized protein with FMN-binding domain